MTRRSRLIPIILVTVMAMATTKTYAQDDPEYLWEIGGGAAAMSYLGDFSSNPVSHIHPAIDATLRRVIDPRSALRLTLSAGSISGTSADEKTYFPDYASEPFRFKRTTGLAEVVYEYNFWAYGTGRDVRGARRTAPFIYSGLGMALATGGGMSTAAGIAWPIGIGFKLKLQERLNLTADAGIVITTTDRLDGRADPYHVTTTSAWKNTDATARISVTLTYSFTPKCRTCNKE